LQAAQNREVVASIQQLSSVKETIQLRYKSDDRVMEIIKSKEHNKTIHPKYKIEDGILYYQTGEDAKK